MAVEVPSVYSLPATVTEVGAAVLGLAVFALPFLPLPDDLRLSGRILAYVAAGILTLAVIRAFYLLYRRKQTCRTIQMVAVGLFCAVFVGGWALPQVNSEIGYRKLCKEAKKVAKEQGAKIILVTRFPKSPAAACADVILQCGANEAPLQLGSVPARMAQLFLIDVLFAEVCRISGPRARTNRERVAAALAERHI